MHSTDRSHVPTLSLTIQLHWHKTHRVKKGQPFTLDTLRQHIVHMKVQLVLSPSAPKSDYISIFFFFLKNKSKSPKMF